MLKISNTAISTTQHLYNSTFQPAQPTKPFQPFRPVADYSMPNVSDKVVKIIISYTDFIKITVWSE
jgi:UDP-N-acetylglucosamine 2-epimerase (non-hydrolysing)